jgi:MtrB/PioB family decaheme-associated outer membrane protein
MSTSRHTVPLPRRALAAAIVLALCLPLAAHAQDDFNLEEAAPAPVDADAIADLTTIYSHVEFGLGWLDDDAFRFGRFNGLDNGGAFAVFGLDWYRRAPYDSPDPTYTRLTVSDLGLDSRRASFEHGRQGNWRVRVDYAQLPMLRSDSGSTIFDGVGGNLLTLPAGWVPRQNTSGMTALAGALHPVELRTDRRRIGLGYDKRLSPRWELSTSYRQESKEGLKSIGGVIGNSGGNPRAVMLPEPVDYDTREAEIALRYTDSRKQFEVRYLVSLFDDATESLVWQNPYLAINGWAPSAGFPTGFGEISLPPDNQFHQASAGFGYTWNESLRLSADLAFGRMTQDEPFLPYTVNPVLAATITQPLPRDSLDGRIDTTVANVRLSGEPTAKFHWSASARYDDRDNQTPRDEYVYIGGDSMTQDTSAASNRRRYNEPYSYRETKLRAEAGYRFRPRTSLDGSVEERRTERTFAERERADETTWSINLRHAAADWFSGTLRFSRADRTGSTYHGDHPFLSGYDPGYTDTIPGGFENPPDLRKYYEADRTRDRFGLSLALTPGEHWSIGFDANRLKDDYRHSELGLRRSESRVYTLDLSFVPSARWSGHAFYTRESMEQDQAGVSTRGATRVEDAADPARHWFAHHDDDVRTYGAGFDWAAIEKRLDIGMDWISARTHGQIDVTGGSALTIAPLPPDRTRLTSLSLYGKYHLRRDLSVQARLWRERYRATDFALDDVEADQLANVILLGEDSDDYDVNVVTVSLTYRF